MSSTSSQGLDSLLNGEVTRSLLGGGKGSTSKGLVFVEVVENDRGEYEAKSNSSASQSANIKQATPLPSTLGSFTFPSMSSSSAFSSTNKGNSTKTSTNKVKRNGIMNYMRDMWSRNPSTSSSSLSGDHLPSSTGRSDSLSSTRPASASAATSAIPDVTSDYSLHNLTLDGEIQDGVEYADGCDQSADFEEIPLDNDEEDSQSSGSGDSPRSGARSPGTLFLSSSRSSKDAESDSSRKPRSDSVKTSNSASSFFRAFTRPSPGSASSAPKSKSPTTRFFSSFGSSTNSIASSVANPVAPSASKSAEQLNQNSENSILRRRVPKTRSECNRISLDWFEEMQPRGARWGKLIQSRHHEGRDPSTINHKDQQEEENKGAEGNSPDVPNSRSPSPCDQDESWDAWTIAHGVDLNGINSDVDAPHGNNDVREGRDHASSADPALQSPSSAFSADDAKNGRKCKSTSDGPLYVVEQKELDSSSTNGDWGCASSARSNERSGSFSGSSSASAECDFACSADGASATSGTENVSKTDQEQDTDVQTACARQASNSLSLIEGEIERDVPRTYPTLSFFQEADVQRQLVNSLKKIAIDHPDVGYVQGMNYVMAQLMLHFPEPRDAAQDMFKLLLETPVFNLRGLYASGLLMLRSFVNLLASFLERQRPALFARLEDLDLDSLHFTFNWFITLFSYTMPFETLADVWEYFFESGWDAIFRVSLVLLMSVEEELLHADFETATLVLRAAPTFPPEDLLRQARRIHLTLKDQQAIREIVYMECV